MASITLMPFDQRVASRTRQHSQEISMLRSVILLVSIFFLSACTLETKSSAELLFPLGQHTWSKGEDYRNAPPSDSCTGCPEFRLSSPSLSSLEANGWRITLDPGDTTTDIVGTIFGHTDYSECGAHNDVFCDNSWRVWAPDSNERAYNQQTPGGNLVSQNFFLKPSFECGISRFVLAAQNTYGTTRVIFEVERQGGVCETTVLGPNLRVILKWNERDTDLDLHLVRSNSQLWDLEGDCHYVNCRPTNNAYATSDLDWGIWGDDADNPFLDVDDKEHAGPENIFWYGAEDGDYYIEVDYHPESTFDLAVLPDVEIWADGILVDWIFYDIDKSALRAGETWRTAMLRIRNGLVSVEQVDSVRRN